MSAIIFDELFALCITSGVMYIVNYAAIIIINAILFTCLIIIIAGLITYNLLLD